MERGEQLGNGDESCSEIADFSSRDHQEDTSSQVDFIHRAERFLKKVSKWSVVVAGVALIAMLAISTGDVIGIKIFNTPIPGAPELTGFLAVVVIAFSMAYTLVEGSHIHVDIFINKLPKRFKGGVEALVFLLSFCLFLVLGWYSVIYGNQLLASNEVSMTQHIPFYPFVWAIALSCLPVCLFCLIEVIKWIRKAVMR